MTVAPSNARTKRFVPRRLLAVIELMDYPLTW
jgi:hypothetical protein